MSRHSFLEALEQRVLIFDGAMGTSIQAYHLSAADYGGKEGCNEYLALVRPQVIEEIHTAFLEAGADALETNTFGGNRLKLAEYGLEDRLYEVNFTAAQIARRRADAYRSAEKPRFVVGSMGPTGMLPSGNDPSLSKITFFELSDIFKEQAAPLVEGGCDALLIETSVDILEVKAAIDGLLRYFAESGRRVPIMAQVSLFPPRSTMLLGTEISAVLTTLEALPVDVLGLNCSTGPEHMREPVRYLCERSDRKISVIPNAGIPYEEEGRTVFPLAPASMAQALKEFVEEFGVHIVGGCCGTTPEHIRQIVAAIGTRPPKERGVIREPAVSSGVRAVALRQEPAPLLVGERVNTQGSRRIKEALLADDYDTALQVARGQVEGGAHVLDVCVALTERADEAEQMRILVKILSMGVEAPLMIDSTEASVVEAALAAYPGKAIINSIHMEDGRGKIERTVPLAKRFGAALICLAIDEEGQAYGVERKVAICHRIHDIATHEYGIPPHDLIFDALTFPVTTGQEELRTAARDTIEATHRIKRELPGVYTLSGVSNVSFGVKPSARAVLNSVFLYHLVEAGLDLAIVNPAHITPYAEIPMQQRQLADDLIFCRREDALARFIQYFEENEAAAPGHATEDPTAGMSVEQRIHWQILHRKREGIEALIDAAVLRQGPVEVLNNVLLPAMKEVGDRFGAGELILPFVLQSAEVMKRAVAQLERYLEKKEGYTKGKVVLATVFGDVHDIGKNLVHTILSNNGYTVYDLGKQVPINTIIDKAVEVGADAIGLSALLVSTSKQMPLCVQELHHRGLKLPVLIGGAAINRQFGRRILFIDDQTPYEPGVFYGKDAFEGLEIIDQLTDPARRPALEEKMRAEARAPKEGPRNEARAAPADERRQAIPLATMRRDAPIPSPPFWGVRLVEEIPLAEVFACFDLKSLYRLSWQAKNLSGAAWERLLRDEFEPWLERLKQEARERGIIVPKAVYGYFPCQSEGNDLIIYDPASLPGAQLPAANAERPPLSVLARFTFPRQREFPGSERLSISHYFAGVDSGQMDVAVFQCVTVGERPVRLVEEAKMAGEYTTMLYLHGFATQAAEATAEWLHRRIRADLGLAPDQGRRYSWGYGACPDLSEHTQLFRLLPCREALRVRLTEAYQLDPEYTTAAIVVHHPQAKYFSMGITRDQQLLES
ncbi:MAG: methionine synthase [Armatimonadetes bacterium]|nr:methionine synthase [Armatimonadota bacterium]